MGGWLDTIVLTVLAMVGAFLIFIILLQRGRGGGIAGALGGMGGQSAFGTKAGDVFTRITVVLALVWVLLNGVAIYALQGRPSRLLEGTQIPTAPSLNSAGGDSTAPASQTPTDEAPTAPVDSSDAKGDGDIPPAPTGDGAAKPEMKDAPAADGAAAKPAPEGEKPADKPAETPAEKPAEKAPEKEAEKPAPATEGSKEGSTEPAAGEKPASDK